MAVAGVLLGALIPGFADLGDSSSEILPPKRKEAALGLSLAPNFPPRAAVIGGWSTYTSAFVFK